MTDPMVVPTPPSPTVSAPRFIMTLATVLVAILVLLGVDAGLARVDKKETRSVAVIEYQVGTRLMAMGRVRDGIDHLRTAASLDRDKPAYTAALAEAVLAEGRPLDAEQLLIPLLEREQRDGAANLAMARVLAKQGRIEEAKSYYHTAIFGLWPEDAERNRTASRFELIDFLAATGAKHELLSELLPIQDAYPDDTLMRKRIAQLFVVAGSPTKAGEIFRDVLRHNSNDTSAYIGLANAAMAQGNYPDARGYYQSAQKLAPDDTAIRSRIKLADSATAIDPTQRGLPLPEQLQRSRNLVQMTIASARKCLNAEAPQVAAALDSVSRSLMVQSSAIPRNQAIEENLSLAGAMWRMRGGRCATRAPNVDEALALVQDKIAQ